jgi:acetyl-CoA C-acetyltransferase
MALDDRLPVVVGTGQSIERVAAVSALDLAAAAARAALEDASGLRHAVSRVSVVNMVSPVGPAPATALARRLGLAPTVTEVSTVGGNSPPMLVARAATAIAAGEAEVVLVAGAEALRSPDASGAPGPVEPELDRAPDTVVGDERAGVGRHELAAGLLAPVNIYALFESALAARAGRTFAEHRVALGELMTPFTRVAASHPFAWFPQARHPGELSTVSADNRLVSEPFTKRLCAVMGVNQGAALVLTSLGAARAAGIEAQAVFCWSSAEACDIWFPTARPDLGRAPGIAVAAAGALGASGIGIDDVDVLDLYSCFPCAVELAADAMGIRLDDHRGLTVTGGLPYFGGPGNNYTLHAIATVVDRLRADGGVALVTGLGWYATKHAVSIYGTEPPPSGYRVADTSAAQQAIDDDAVAVADGVVDDASGSAVVVGATVAHGPDAAPFSAPVIARLGDGRHVAAVAEADALSSIQGRNLVGTTVRVHGTPPRYRLEG